VQEECEEKSRSMRNKVSKKQLIALRGNRCEECGLDSLWNGKSLTIQIHGHKTENPRLLCPNCHTQTDDWAGKHPNNRGENNSSKRPEQRAAKSIRMSGKNHPMYGKKNPRQSERMKNNNPMSRPDLRALQSARMKGTMGYWNGKNRSETTKQKISTTCSDGRRKGENNSIYGRTGENHPNYGKHYNVGENHPGFGKKRPDMSIRMKEYWFNLRKGVA